MRIRHAFASTDDIILDFRAGDYIQGDDVKVSHIPRFHINVLGTAPIRELVIFHNFHPVFRTHNQEQHLELNWKDKEPQPGENMYYVRIEQRDGEIAWSSPIWLHLPEEVAQP
jgi:hypothetical protein